MLCVWVPYLWANWRLEKCLDSVTAVVPCRWQGQTIRVQTAKAKLFYGHRQKLLEQQTININRSVIAVFHSREINLPSAKRVNRASHTTGGRLKLVRAKISFNKWPTAPSVNFIASSFPKSRNFLFSLLASNPSTYCTHCYFLVASERMQMNSLDRIFVSNS